MFVVQACSPVLKEYFLIADKMLLTSKSGEGFFFAKSKGLGVCDTLCADFFATPKGSDVISKNVDL